MFFNLPHHADAGKKWHRVSPNRPCPVCGKPDWCARNGDAVLCMRVDSPPPGWQFVKRVIACGETGTVFRRIGFAGECDLWRPKPKAKPKTTDRNWNAEAERYRGRAESAGMLRKLVEHLGAPITVDALRLLRVGWDGFAWTCPECDAAGNVVGISRRFTDGRKGFMLGGHRGLIVPANLDELPDPVFVVEGMSDSAAMLSVGSAAVGRPSAKGGIDYLASLLAGRDVVILGERDQKPNGFWPGLSGARAVAQELSRRWQREVKWTLPPEPYKDARAWLAVEAKGGRQ